MVIINETINVTAPVFFETVGSNSIVQRTIELITAPYHHKEMLWIALPLIAGLFLMQLYFGMYKKEELGWNTAVGNSLALIFVSMDLFRQIYLRTESKVIADIISSNFGEVIFISFISFVSLWLLFGDFFHLFPKRLAFIISSSLPTTLIAYMGIVLIYTNVPFDGRTLIASILLFIIFAVLFKVIHFFEPIVLKE